MNLLELAQRLVQMANERGDQPVYYGSYYQDRLVTMVVWEDDYPVIMGPDKPAE